jgi:hypothetical protein
VVTRQSVRQAARRATMNGRRARAERERRLEGLAIDVLVAIRRRDSAIEEAEAAAGEALRAMLDGGVCPSAQRWSGAVARSLRARHPTRAGSASVVTQRTNASAR